MLYLQTTTRMMRMRARPDIATAAPARSSSKLFWTAGKIVCRTAWKYITNIILSNKKNNYKTHHHYIDIILISSPFHFAGCQPLVA